MKKFTTTFIDDYLHKRLFIKELMPYVSNDVLFNGLQVHSHNQITKIGFGVSANNALFERAQTEKCDAIIVHHGLNGKEPWLDSLTEQRFAWLIRHNIALWSFHFLLDAHPVIGHNAQIFKKLGIAKTEPYFFHGEPWGRMAKLSTPTTFEKVFATLQPFLSPRTTMYPFGSKKIQRIACVSGKGAPYIDGTVLMQEQGIDLFITGEIHEWNREAFREAGIHCIAGGHYHTECFGLRALQREIEQKYKIPTSWLDVANEI